MYHTIENVSATNNASLDVRYGNRCFKAQSPSAHDPPQRKNCWRNCLTIKYENAGRGALGSLRGACVHGTDLLSPLQQADLLHTAPCNRMASLILSTASQLGRCGRCHFKYAQRIRVQFLLWCHSVPCEFPSPGLCILII